MLCFNVVYYFVDLNHCIFFVVSIRLEFLEI